MALLGLGNDVWSTRHLRFATALLLLAFGLWKLLRPRHPRWVGMRLGARDLTLWSFVMATAHGAGLMLLPVFLLAGGSAECGTCARHSGLSLNSWPGYLGAVFLHSAAMLLVAAVVAGLVYVKWGLGLLRTAWFNLDLLWSFALLGSGAAALVA